MRMSYKLFKLDTTDTNSCISTTSNRCCLSLQSPTTITATPTSRTSLSNTATVFRQVEATPLNNSSHHSLRDSFPATLLPCGPNSLLRILALLLSRPSWTSLTEESRTRRRSPTLLSVRLPLQIVIIVRHHPTTAQREESSNMKEARTEVCPACDGAHSIYQCTTFGAWTVDRRHGLVRRKHLCFNCLGSNHSIEACTSRRTCRECSQKQHHTLLHRPAANFRPADTTDVQQSAFNGMLTPSHSPEPTEASVSEPAAPLPAAGEESSSTSLYIQTETGEPDLSPAQFPVTALATVSAGPLSRRARILILVDSGSAITFVTARLANSINAPKIKSRMVIRGMQNSTVARSSHAVRLTLKPLSGDPHDPVIVLAHVVDWITDIELQDLSSVHDQPFLRGKPLADPGAGPVWYGRCFTQCCRY